MAATLKKTIEAFLKRLGVYQRVKFSRLYDLYWGVVDRKWIDNRDQEIRFFQKTLVGFQQGNIVFDVGANQGYKTDVFLRLGARVVAVEPDSSNEQILKSSFHKFRMAKKPVIIIGKAVSDHSGVETMFVDAPGSALNTLNAKWVDTLRNDSVRFGKSLNFREKMEVETVTVEELIDTHGRPFYMKIDVEGYEATVLKGMGRSVPYISLEVNLPEFEPEALECIALLERLGPGGSFNYTADCVHGFDLPNWLAKKEFMVELKACRKPSIEVFWRAPQ